MSPISNETFSLNKNRKDEDVIGLRPCGAV